MSNQQNNNSQVKLLKIKKSTKSKVDLCCSVISVWCLLNNIDISKTNIMILSYFMVYGISRKTEDLILKSKILKSLSSLRNRKVFLRKNNLIYFTEDNETFVNPSLQSTVNHKVGIIIELNNISDDSILNDKMKVG